jgi:hypothetical protein
MKCFPARDPLAVAPGLAFALAWMMMAMSTSAHASFDDWIVIVEQYPAGQNPETRWQGHHAGTPRTPIQGDIIESGEFDRDTGVVVWIYAPLINTMPVTFDFGSGWHSKAFEADVVARVPAASSKISTSILGQSVPLPGLGIVVRRNNNQNIGQLLTFGIEEADREGQPRVFHPSFAANIGASRVRVGSQFVCRPFPRMVNAQLSNGFLAPGQTATLTVVQDRVQDRICGSPPVAAHFLGLPYWSPSHSDEQLPIGNRLPSTCFEITNVEGEPDIWSDHMVLGRVTPGNTFNTWTIRAKQSCHFGGHDIPDFRLRVCYSLSNRQIPRSVFVGGSDCRTFPMAWQGTPEPVEVIAPVRISSVQVSPGSIPGGVDAQIRVELKDIPEVAAWHGVQLSLQASSDNLGFFVPASLGMGGFPPRVGLALNPHSQTIMGGYRFATSKTATESATFSVERPAPGHFIITWPFRTIAVPFEENVVITVEGRGLTRDQLELAEAGQLLSTSLPAPSQVLQPGQGAVRLQTVLLQPPIPSVRRIREGESLSLTIQLDKPAGARTIVQLESSARSALIVPAEIVFERGEQSKTIMLTGGRLSAGSPAEVTITARLDGRQEVQATQIEIQPSEVLLR